ncbi:MAG: hypothetical protein RLZZ248_400 [Bacteroidota bacterium]|jgi:hypothetical protein
MPIRKGIGIANLFFEIASNSKVDLIKAKNENNNPLI